MDVAEFDRIASALTGVAQRRSGGLSQWRYRGRLVARQLDATHVVIRTDFAPRDELLSVSPGTFQVPARYKGHMMVVANLESGDDNVIEDALMAGPFRPATPESRSAVACASVPPWCARTGCAQRLLHAGLIG